MKNEEFNNVKITNEKDGFSSFEFGHTQEDESTFFHDNKSEIRDEVNDNPTKNNPNNNYEQKKKKEEDELREQLTKSNSSSESSNSSSGSSSASSGASAASSSAAASAASTVAAVSLVAVATVSTLVGINVFINAKVKMNTLDVTPVSVTYNLDLSETNNDKFIITLENKEREFYSYKELVEGNNVGDFINLVPETKYDLSVIDTSSENYSIYHEELFTPKGDVPITSELYLFVDDEAIPLPSREGTRGKEYYIKKLSLTTENTLTAWLDDARINPASISDLIDKDNLMNVNYQNMSITPKNDGVYTLLFTLDENTGSFILTVKASVEITGLYLFIGNEMLTLPSREGDRGTEYYIEELTLTTDDTLTAWLNPDKTTMAPIDDLIDSDNLMRINYSNMSVTPKKDGVYNFVFALDDIMGSFILTITGSPDYYQVTFDAFDGSSSYEIQTIVPGGIAELPQVDPSSESIPFIGWTLHPSAANPEIYDFSEPVNSDLTLYAVYGTNLLSSFDILEFYASEYEPHLKYSYNLKSYYNRYDNFIISFSDDSGADPITVSVTMNANETINTVSLDSCYDMFNPNQLYNYTITARNSTNDHTYEILSGSVVPSLKGQPTIHQVSLGGEIDGTIDSAKFFEIDGTYYLPLDVVFSDFENQFGEEFYFEYHQAGTNYTPDPVAFPKEIATHYIELDLDPSLTTKEVELDYAMINDENGEQIRSIETRLLTLEESNSIYGGRFGESGISKDNPTVDLYLVSNNVTLLDIYSIELLFEPIHMVGGEEYPLFDEDISYDLKDIISGMDIRETPVTVDLSQNERVDELIRVLATYATNVYIKYKYAEEDEYMYQQIYYKNSFNIY